MSDSEEVIWLRFIEPHMYDERSRCSGSNQRVVQYSDDDESDRAVCHVCGEDVSYLSEVSE
jgi:hypothetical protein